MGSSMNEIQKIVSLSLRRISQVRELLVPIPSEYLGHVRFVNSLIRNGHSISTVLDIGANKGDWTRYIKRYCLPKAKFLLVEPQIQYSSALAKLGSVIPVLLSDEAKTVTFYSRGDSGDSYYMEKTGHHNGLTGRQERAYALADLALSIPSIDLVKIDTQGSELDILVGFRDLLGQVQALILELPVLEYNEGSPSFDTYLDFVVSNGFAPKEIIDQHFVDGVLTQLDIGFSRSLTGR